MQTLTAAAAAKILNVHVETLYLYAAQGKVPGSRVGHKWIFIEEEIERHLKELQCPSTNEKARAFGGSSSSTEAEAYRRALAPATAKQQSKSKRGASVRCGSTTD